MKNKGRKHLATTGNAKGWLTGLTRPIQSMAKKDKEMIGYSNKFMKKKWSKRVRGYFKSQTKELL